MLRVGICYLWNACFKATTFNFELLQYQLTVGKVGLTLDLAGKLKLYLMHFEIMPLECG